MAQVQLSTKISIETHYKLEQLSNEMEFSKAAIVEKSLLEFFDKNHRQQSLFEKQAEGKVERSKDGKFKKA